jgi:hypothetical protein
MPSRLRALFALPFAAMALAAPHPSWGAGVATPKPVTPAPGAVSESLPVFGWDKVATADRYEFQVAADNGFNSPVAGSGEDHFVTKNTRATLKRTIPTGTYYWRVRAITKAGAVSPWTPPQQFKRSWTAAATLQAPAAGVGLSFPANPLSLSWSSVTFATSYLVSVATDPSLGSLVLHDAGSTAAISTVATTLTSPSVFAPGTYYWAVRPVDARGNKGVSSSVAAFSWGWPSTTAPTVDDVVAAPEVYDPRFTWTAVPGAARYEVEVNPTPDFVPGSKVCCTGTTIATTLSPTVVLKDNVYYWRVRAIDADGNAGVWNTGPSFAKTFDKVPPVTTPSVKNLRMVDTSDGALAGPTPYSTTVPIIRWDPVPGASSYQVDVAPVQSGVCNWSSSIVPPERWSSVTATTAWTPLGYQWNSVKPYNDAHAVASDQATLVAGHSYCARVRARSDRDSAGGDVYGDYTYLAGGGQAFTWTGAPTPAPCAAPCNPAAGDYVLPQTGTSTTRMPFFTWKPLQGRGSYFVLVSKDASFSNIVDYAFTQLPAYAPRAQTVTTYPDEATFYYWAVLPATAANGNGVDIGPLDASARSFVKLSTPPALVAPAEASTVTGQPTFQWSTVEAARNYRIQVSQDPSFGATLEDTTTDATTYTPTTTYPADTVLYWRVRANDENQVGLSWSATGTFRRTLPAPVPSPLNPTSGDQIPTWTWAPVTGAVSYDVSVDLPDGTHKDLAGIRMPALTATTMTGTGLFRWRVRANFPKGLVGSVIPGPFSGDMTFTRTIGEPAGAHSELTRDRLVLSWEPKTGAKEYRIQVSTTPDFAIAADDVRTDNTNYAPLLTQPAYTNGGTLYWRVAAVDADRNQGDYSPAQKIGFAKKMRVYLTRFPMRGRKSAVVVNVVDMTSKPVAGAAVRVTGKGLKVGARRTTKTGKATFQIRGRKGLSIVFRVVKTGFDAATYTYKVR